MIIPHIFDIVRGSQEDGPGIRTVIFFKGCPLRCRWCQNPESQDCRREIVYRSSECRRCGNCRKACPEGAIDLVLKHAERKDRCSACGRCVDACDSMALRIAGSFYSVEELVKMILRDRVYFEVSGGGVTLSGGEPMVHMELIAPLLSRLKTYGIHVAIETCGAFNYEDFKKTVLPLVDLVYFDIKFADTREHERHTGSGNSQIMLNLKLLASEPGVDFVPRIPLIPRYTAKRENLLGIAKVLRDLAIKDCKFLTYNPSGMSKYSMLGKTVPKGLPKRPLNMREEHELKDLFMNELHRHSSVPDKLLHGENEI